MGEKEKNTKQVEGRCGHKESKFENLQQNESKRTGTRPTYLWPRREVSEPQFKVCLCVGYQYNSARSKLTCPCPYKAENAWVAFRVLLLHRSRLASSPRLYACCLVLDKSKNVLTFVRYRMHSTTLTLNGTIVKKDWPPLVIFFFVALEQALLFHIIA